MRCLQSAVRALPFVAVVAIYRSQPATGTVHVVAFVVVVVVVVPAPSSSLSSFMHIAIVVVIVAGADFVVSAICSSHLALRRRCGNGRNLQSATRN